MSRKPIKQSTIKNRAAKARKPQVPDIDFSAALPPASPTPVNPAASSINNNIYIKKESINELSRKISLRGNSIDDNNNLSSDDELLALNEIKGIEDKTELKPKEIKFLEYYFDGQGLSLDLAVKKAGYKSKDPQSRGIIGKRIVEKYVGRVPDHKKIFRDIGYSEVKIALLLVNSAEKAQSETVRLNARIALAKCLGMQRDVIEGDAGMNIVFYPQFKDQQGPSAPQEAPKREPLALPPPPKKLNIIK